MTFIDIINKIANIGVKKNYKPWEVLLTRKLNLSSLLGFINVCFGLIAFSLIGYYDSVFECLVILLLAPLVFFLNFRFNYIFASYLFTLMGCFLFFFISVKTGPDAFSILYFFPFVLVLTQMLGRRETYVHLVILFILCFLTILAIIFSYHFSLFNVAISEKLISSVKYVNIIISFFIAVAYVFIISFEANKQERHLKSAIKQKDVLLAELFHRVKNNLNIVTSLLNLKKNSMTSREAQSALEECREMVFSMALVHNKMYTSNNIEQLNFKDYLDTLIPELVRSFGGKEKVDVDVNVPEIIFDLSQAIPCGLIINEFITNAFKHAQVEGRKLKIQVNLVEENGYVDIELTDNGPGVMTPQQEESSLGLGLIKSLTDQLGGTCNFINNGGLKFNLKFKR